VIFSKILLNKTFSTILAADIYLSIKKYIVNLINLSSKQVNALKIIDLNLIKKSTIF